MSFDKAAWSRSPAQLEKRRLDAQQRQQEHTAYLQRVKLATGCVDCGYRDDPAKLHFDHKTWEDKRYALAVMSTHSRARVDEEISKCDVRCVRCHARRHAREAA